MTQANNVGILTPKINSSGQLDATTGLSGSVPVANGGTGAASYTANNVLLGNGTSAFQAVAPGSSGNVLTSNGTTWQSTAPAGGGVTSLNGQTGVIDNTTQYAIGSYIMGRPKNNTVYNNSTIAGSSLWAVGAGMVYVNNSEAPNAFVTIAATTSVYTGQNVATLINTGSWRCVSYAGIVSTSGADGSLPGLWVRYA